MSVKLSNPDSLDSLNNPNDLTARKLRYSIASENGSAPAVAQVSSFVTGGGADIPLTKTNTFSSVSYSPTISVNTSSKRVDTSSVTTLTVTTTEDQNDGSPVNGFSLRDALFIANQNRNNQYVILLQGNSRYSLTIVGYDYDGISGSLDISPQSNVTIKSQGSQPATIDATAARNSVFSNLGILTLENIVVTGGSSYYGGIYNDGQLTLINTTIKQNNATRGGGLYNEGDATILNSTIPFLNEMRESTIGF